MADRKQPQQPQAQPQQPQQAQQQQSPPAVGAVDLGGLIGFLTSPTVISTLMYLLTKLQQQPLPVGANQGQNQPECPEAVKKAVDSLVEEIGKA